MLNILIPIAGSSAFFPDTDHGYPKIFQEVLGKPMIQICIENLMGLVGDKKFIFIVNEADVILVSAPLEAGAAHFNPVASAESAVNIVLFAPTPSLASTVVKVNKSPFVVSGVTSAVVVQAGTPEEIDKTWPLDPIGKRVFVLAVADE